MITLSIALSIFLVLEPEVIVWLVQVAVENAAAIKDLAAALFFITKASKFLRKNQNK